MCVTCFKREYTRSCLNGLIVPTSARQRRRELYDSVRDISSRATDNTDDVGKSWGFVTEEEDEF